MKFITVQEYALLIAAGAFVVAGWTDPFPHEADSQPSYSSQFEVPYHQDLPAHTYIYQNSLPTNMPLSGSTVPFSWNESSAFPLFKVEWHN